MQTTEALKRQIDTTEDLASVVRTMKTLAAVNIRQYEAAADSLQEYDRTIRSAVQMLAWNDHTLQNTTTTRSRPRTGLIVFGSDQGMCGGFNEAIANHVEELLCEQEPLSRETPLVVLGRRIAMRLVEAGYAVEDSVDLPGAAAGITLMLQHLLPQIDLWRQQQSLESVVVCHNRRLSQTQYEPTRRQLLPISPRGLAADLPQRWPGSSLPLVTMPTLQFWQAIARQHLFVSLFHACAESQASENAARIAAMQAAETHIHDRLSDLNRDFQQLRQTSITEELLDVITGFEALTAG